MLWRALQGLRAFRSNKREEIEAHQARQLRSVVHHAVRRVPYYRRLFERVGLRPEAIRTPADLERLPILTRSDVRENQDRDLLSEDFDPGSLVAHVTNATTGYPLTIRRTVFEERFLQGLRLLHTFQLGMRPLDRRVIVRCPDPLSRGDGIEKTWWTRIGLLRTEIANCLWSPEAILASIRDLRPEVLGGYPGSLAWVAGHVTEQDRLLIHPRYVATGGETLTENMRRQIAEGFGVPVYDFYAANEFNLIAAECPRGGGCYHLCEASLIAEVLRDGRPVEPGESGELVATGLFSHAMPLIRYRLGDEVTLGETGCQCGAPVKTLKRIDGRTADRFVLPNGETFHPYVIEVPLLQSTPWLRQHQIVQERPDKILLKTVPLRGRSPSPEELAKLGRRLTAATSGAEVVPTLVDEIPVSPSGKFKLYLPLSTPQ